MDTERTSNRIHAILIISSFLLLGGKGAYTHEARACSIVLLPGDLTADCSGRNLTHLPPDLPRNIATLLLNDNPNLKLDNVEWHLFKKVDHLSLINTTVRFFNLSNLHEITNLTSLALRKNNIKSFRPREFAMLPRLRFLDLSENALEKLDPDLFVGLGNLRRLDLEGNSLRYVHGSTFKPLSGLIKLNLNSNHLKEIPGRIFEKLWKVEKIIVKA